MRKKMIRKREFGELSGEERCCVCGKLTNQFEIYYNAVLCGEDCAVVMDNRVRLINEPYPSLGKTRRLLKLRH